jgi:hypothetical protein
MRDKVAFRYNEIEEFNRKYEAWQREHPLAKEISVLQTVPEHPSFANGLNEGIVEYEEP